MIPPSLSLSLCVPCSGVEHVSDVAAAPLGLPRGHPDPQAAAGHPHQPQSGCLHVRHGPDCHPCHPAPQDCLPLPLPGHTPSVTEDCSLLGQHANLLVGLDGIHSIIKHASRFSYNARKRLEPLQYTVKLMDFFTQDFVRSYLHSIGVTSDDHLERRRRFDVLLSALVDRVEAS